MEPQITINFVAVAVAVVASFILGSLWYGPLFGKAWGAEMGVDMDEKPSGAFLAKAMGLMVVGAFLTAWVLAHNMAVWMPTTWGHAADGSQAWQYGLMAAFFTWLGFYLPQHFNTVTWNQQSWKLFAINGAYTFVTLNVVAQILAHMPA